MKKRIAIITGASSGIGQEFVRQLDQCTRTIEEVWIIARRKERLMAVKKEVQNLTVRVFNLDICKESDLNILSGYLMEESPMVRVLVNAAGAGRAGRFDRIELKDAVNMVELNDRALVSITYMVLPYMTRPGNILQLASASAFMPQKEFAVYAASKAFVLSFSRALYAELRKSGIMVTAVCPGPVDTEFLQISNKGNRQKPLKRLVTVKAGPVVRKALQDARAGKEISVYGLPMKAVLIAAKFLPHRLFLR